MWEVGDSNPDGGPEVGGVFPPSGELLSTEYVIYCKFLFELVLAVDGWMLFNDTSAQFRPFSVLVLVVKH